MRHQETTFERVAARALAAGALTLTLAACGPEKVSRFGAYEGFSEPRYNEFVRTSLYVPVRDGTKIAVDVFRPSVDGRPVAEPMPAVFELTRYWRAELRPDGRVHAVLMGFLKTGGEAQEIGGVPTWHTTLLRHGYAVVVGETRGTGASSGKNPGPLTRFEAQDAHDVIEWIAAQPWCDSNVGMAGDSQSGTNQLVTLRERPPHLKAIFPAVANLDLYRVLTTNGILLKGSLMEIAASLKELAEAGAEESEGEESLPVPVDGDPAGEMRDAARREHGEGSYERYTRFLRSSPVLDEVAAELGLTTLDEKLETLLVTEKLLARIAERPDLQRKLMTVGLFRDDPHIHPAPILVPAEHLDEINAAGVPAYVWGGWRDFVSPRDPFLWYANLTAPVKVAVGPWSHYPATEETKDVREIEALRIRAVETLRWFDRWLKGFENGVLDEPRVQYALVSGATAWQWRGTDAWPPEEVRATRFYFQPGPSGSVESQNDGVLSGEPPEEGADVLTVNYQASVPVRVRAPNTDGREGFAPDLAANDARGLTYTTAPLANDVAVVGHPVIVLYLSASAADAEVDVYLEDVEPGGFSRFVTDGAARALHRTLGDPPYDNLGLPYLTSLAADGATVAPLTDAVTELSFDFQPTAWRFRAGHRLRVTIQGANAESHWTFPTAPAERITIERNRRAPSHIVLPVLDLP